MKTPVKEKQSYGTVKVDNFSPSRADGWPEAINVTLSFEETLKLNLGLQQALLDMNRLNRSTTAGRKSAVNLCIFTGGQITINRGRLR
jgi:hypothetical protein